MSTPDSRPAKPETTTSTSGAFTNAEVRELVKLVNDNAITELRIERDNGTHKILIKRAVPAPVIMTAPHTVASNAKEIPISLAASPMPGSVIPDPGAPPQDSFHKVVAPMVGTFYGRPDPKEPAFVNEGDMVEKDQVIGIIEAMKIMNEIKSEHRGRCVRLSVQNGQPVEYGQTIMLLEPA